jgi:hypothetical protein
MIFYGEGNYQNTQNAGKTSWILQKIMLADTKGAFSWH